MHESERELRLLRDRALDMVNTLRNRMAAIASQMRELDGAALTTAQRSALNSIAGELSQTLDLGDALLAAAGYERRDVPHVSPEAPPARPAHILVVEDDPSNRAIMVRILARMGHHVTPVADGLEAFDALSMGGVDCIVSDFQMPHLGGGSLYQQVEGRLPHYAGRFVFVTGDYTRDATRDFLQRTGQPVLGKPYEVEELVAAVARVLAKRTV
ncbi:MAG: response regulator [Gemmatimonadales bacterium]